MWMGVGWWVCFLGGDRGWHISQPTRPVKQERRQHALLVPGAWAACTPPNPLHPQKTKKQMTQGVSLNGDEQSRYWGNVNLSFAYVEGESLLMGLKVGDIALCVRE